MIFKQNWSRRKFLSVISAAGASTALMQFPFTALALDDIDPRVAAIVAGTIGVDTHNHIDVPLNTAEVPGPGIDLAGEMKRSGLTAICMTFALDYQKLQSPGEAFERFMNGLASMDQQLAGNGMRRSLDLAELNAAHEKRQPTVIQAIEGGHFLEGKLERVEIAYNRGLRLLGLLHDSDASVPLGDIYTNDPKWGGLTAFGASVIKECNRLGIVVDLTHCDNNTINMAIKVSQKPMLVSHTGLNTQPGSNPRMAQMMKPRLISKEQAKLIADAGGIIGVWTHLSDSPIEYAHNIAAMVDVVGIDHVCLGTDTKLTPAYRSPQNPNEQGKSRPDTEREGNPNGGNSTGSGHQGPPTNGQGGPGGQRFGERTNRVWEDQKIGFYYVVVDALLKAGFNRDEISKIGGGNYLRIFNAATSK